MLKNQMARVKAARQIDGSARFFAFSVPPTMFYLFPFGMKTLSKQRNMDTDMTTWVKECFLIRQNICTMTGSRGCTYLLTHLSKTLSADKIKAVFLSVFCRKWGIHGNKYYCMLGNHTNLDVEKGSFLVDFQTALSSAHLLEHFHINKNTPTTITKQQLQLYFCFLFSGMGKATSHTFSWW